MNMPTVTLTNKDAGRAARRQAPIHAYVGGNGGGKTLAMVHDTLPSLHAGRRVLSTVALIDPRTGEHWPNYERLEHPSQLLEATHADVLFDEVVGIASSRESQGMPVQIANLLVQLRRRDVVLRWSAPAWARADKIIRETSQAVTVCYGLLSKQSKSPDRLWPEKRLFRWKTYDTRDFEEWTASKSGRLSADKSAWFWRPNSEAMHSYNTLDAVSTLGYPDEFGNCVHCGGRRPRPLCKCGDTHAPAFVGSVTAGREGSYKADDTLHAELHGMGIAY
jgi:hypothetical protein